MTKGALRLKWVSIGAGLVLLWVTMGEEASRGHGKRGGTFLVVSPLFRLTALWRHTVIMY